MKQHRGVWLRAVFAIAGTAGLCVAAGRGVEVQSPDGRVRFEILDGVQYRISHGGQEVIAASALGLALDGVNLAEGAKAMKAVRGRTRQDFRWFGLHPRVRATCNTLRVPFEGVTGFEVEVWACDDGAAFRYRVAGTGRRTPDEATIFRPAKGSTVWYHDLEGHYEAIHTEKKVEDVPGGEWAAPPLTFRLSGGGFASITEGALTGYAGMALQSDGKGGFAARLGHSHPPSYPFRLRYKNDIERVSKQPALMGRSRRRGASC